MSKERHHFLEFGIWIFFGICYLFFGAFNSHVVYAADYSIYKQWTFTSEDDINAWSYAELDEGMLTSEGFQFDVTEQVAFFRALPKGFHRNVDAIRVEYNATGLEQVELLFISVNDGVLRKEMGLTFIVHDGGSESRYVSLSLHHQKIRDANMIAIRFYGTAENISFNGISFFHYSLLQKTIGAWQSFWKLEPIQPFSINILHGPVIDIDMENSEIGHEWHVLAQSINSYLLVYLSIFGVVLLFFAAWRTHHCSKSWNVSSRSISIIFLTVLAGVWIFYDFRMGAEFIRGIATDHTQYITANSYERTFRDLKRFPDFLKFASLNLEDTDVYEVLLEKRWPYFSMLRYTTYPARPNPDDPISDIWVIYNRTDISVDNDGRLLIKGDPFTEPGKLVAQFDANSFIYRATPL